MVTIVIESPSSTTVITIAGFITASVDPTCSESEVSSLETQSNAVDEAIATVDSALTAVQADLETATGTTASSAALDEAVEAAEAEEAAAAAAEPILHDID